MKIEEIANFYQEVTKSNDLLVNTTTIDENIITKRGVVFFQDLDGDDVMILDGLNLIYVWVGNGANPEEKQAARETADVC